MERLDAFAYVQWFMAQVDGDIAPEEAELIQAEVRLAAMALGHSEQTSDTLTAEARTRLEADAAAGTAGRAFHAALDRLRRGFQGAPEVMHAVERTLMKLAGADGRTRGAEEDVIATVIARWQDARA